ncbi:kinase-like protein [Aureobasidium pullulans]|nr:kinase-like protein [Aureobasidium pullulans]
MSSRFFKDLRERIHQKTNESFCEEVHRALRESLQPEIESSDLFVTAQSCKDVWEAYRRYHKMSFLQLVAKEMRWSQDVKKRIHKDRLNTLSALVWLVNDWKSFVKLVRLFKLEEQEFTILEDINVRAHTNTKHFDEILDIRLSDSNKRHSPDEIRDDIKRAQQIFFPVQILPMSDIPQKLPAGRRMPFLEVARIYPPKSNRSGLSAEKSVARVKIADGYLPPISRTNSVVAVKKAMVSKVNKERRALSKLAQYESRPDSIMVCLGAVQIGEICYIVSDLALCDLRMVLNQQLDEGCINRLPPTDELRGPSYLLGGALGIAKGLEWLHWELPHFYDQPQECFHLDLKPSNILVFGAEKSWMWKIADFGEASICVHDERANNGEGTDERSPVTTTRRAPDVYQAPEVEIENGVVGRACDIWSFGCILLDILAFASFSHTGVKRLQAVRSDARENSVRMPIAFYGREGGTGTPSLKAELIEMFRDTSILGSPWLSIGHAPAPKWIKRYVSRIKAEKTLITDTGQWLIHQSSEHIGSLSLGETVLWDDIEGLPQLQTCFSGAIQLENVKFMDTSDIFLAVLCVGTSPADNVIMVQRLDQEELSEEIHVIDESSPMGLSVSCDGLVLVCFRNYVRLHCPGSVSYDKHFGTSELQTACFSDDGKHVYAWSIEDSGSNGTRTRSWYVWETTSWETPPRLMKHRVQWKNTQRSATHVMCRETMVPLNGIPYQFDKDDAPPGGTVLLHFMYFDHLGNVTLISSQSTTLSSFQLPHRITGVYQAYALLEGHRPKICLVRSQVGRGFKVEVKILDPMKVL